MFSNHPQRLLGVRTYLKMAGGPGFEPGFTASKAAVLPLDDPPSGVRL